MKSENYRQLLNNEFETKEMTKEDFDNTLMHFANLYHKEQLKLCEVGVSLPKVCTGCGRLSIDKIGKQYLACCPDNNYIPLRDYIKKSKYIDVQFPAVN